MSNSETTTQAKQADKMSIKMQRIRKMSVFDWVYTIAGFGIGWEIGHFSPILTLIFIVEGYVVHFLFKRYLKNHKISLRLAGWIAWSNLILWAIPIVGLISSICTLVLMEKSPSEKKYKYLGSIGLFLSLANVLLGILLKLGYVRF